MFQNSFATNTYLHFYNNYISGTHLYCCLYLGCSTVCPKLIETRREFSSKHDALKRIGNYNSASYYVKHAFLLLFFMTKLVHGQIH